MIRQLFKLIWNQKKKNALILVGIFFCFMVMFWVTCTATYSFINYTIPLGYDVKNVYLLQVNFKDLPDSIAKETLDQIKSRLTAMPEIKGVTASPTLPFLSWGATQSAKSDVFTGPAIQWGADDAFASVLGLHMIKGRWFNKTDDAATRQPAVITEEMETKFFKGKPGLRQTFVVNDTRYEVVGVCKNVRNETFSISSPGYFVRMSPNAPIGSFLLNMKSPADVEGADRLILQTTAITNSSQGKWYVDGVGMYNLQKNQIHQFSLILLAVGIVCGFLILNAILGLWGVLWLNVSKRSAEIGLRRAVGALARDVYRQFLGEAAVLATLGIIPGTLLALQFPFLNVLPGVSLTVYSLSIIISILLVYTLVLACAFYPSWRASRIQPALVLHEN